MRIALENALPPSTASSSHTGGAFVVDSSQGPFLIELQGSLETADEATRAGWRIGRLDLATSPVSHPSLSLLLLIPISYFFILCVHAVSRNQQ